VFDEFKRLDQQSPWGEKGLGLGLSICDRIGKILGAELTIRSRQGRGSAFGICVPRARATTQQRTARASSAARPPRGTLRAVHVLCVEDDVNILDALRELLTRWEMKVTGVDTPAKARAAIREQRVDVVLADYHLHGEPLGLDVLLELTSQACDGQPIRGALITADAKPDLAQTARGHGFPLLRKPVRPAALRALIAGLVHNTPDPAPHAHSKVDTTSV
jgi:CheY-like chemotaxis protein